MSHLQSIIDYIEEIMLESTESHSLEADDDYTKRLWSKWFNSALYAVLSKIEEIERKEFEKIVQVNSKS